ncbi:hypothetical protein [Spirillospora sp. CA-294931]|uniref:hypothetical protein n=1 Tax=Spirillospora sp. CA-294931 TaxID=3240042 RepID=UPI003D94A47A
MGWKVPGATWGGEIGGSATWGACAPEVGSCTLLLGSGAFPSGPGVVPGGGEPDDEPLAIVIETEAESSAAFGADALAVRVVVPGDASLGILTVAETYSPPEVTVPSEDDDGVTVSFEADSPRLAERTEAVPERTDAVTVIDSPGLAVVLDAVRPR